MTPRWVFRDESRNHVPLIRRQVPGVRAGTRPTSEQDIVYSKAGTDELKLGYLAASRQRGHTFPAVFVIHGGSLACGK